jgi:hypothetical protein
LDIVDIDDPVASFLSVLSDADGNSLAFEVDKGSISPVPEPATLLLVGSGLAAIAGIRRKRRRK